MLSRDLVPISEANTRAANPPALVTSNAEKMAASLGSGAPLMTDLPA
jgi:hypothetical protein